MSGNQSAWISSSCKSQAATFKASRTGHRLGMHPNAKIHRVSSATWTQPTTSWLCSEIPAVISEVSKGGSGPYYNTTEPEPTRCKFTLSLW
jgi:hypothetical protein